MFFMEKLCMIFDLRRNLMCRYIDKHYWQDALLTDRPPYNVAITRSHLLFYLEDFCLRNCIDSCFFENMVFNRTLKDLKLVFLRLVADFSPDVEFQDVDFDNHVIFVELDKQNRSYSVQSRKDSLIGRQPLKFRLK